MTLPVGQDKVEWNIAKVKVQSIHAGVAAPDFSATTLEGKPFKLADQRGKLVLLDFWATWCGPCVAEIPNVKSLYEKYGGENFVVVGISFDEDAATARKFTSDRRLPWIQIWAEGADDGPVAGLYGVGGIPVTFLIGPDGKVIERDLHGEELTDTVAREMRKLAGGDAGEESKGEASKFAGALKRLLSGVRSALPAPLPEESPEARAVLDATLARYRALRSYRDCFSTQARLVQGDQPPQVGMIEGSLAWAEDRIAAKSDLLHVYADGREVTRYWPDAARFMHQSQPSDLVDALGKSEWFSFGPHDPGIHPLAKILASTDETTGPILVVTGVEPATRENRSGRALHGRFRMKGLDEGDALPFTAFIDDRRQLFEEFRLDYTEAYRTALRESYEGDPEAVKEAEIVITLRDIETNGTIENTAFVLNAPAAREFNPFGGVQMDEGPQPGDLIGRLAPSLSATAHDGSCFNLADHRDQAVLVVFWASWAPQAETVLRELQGLVRNDDAIVRVVGVSRNGPAGDEAVRGVIARSGATYPQIADHDGRLGESWNVTCLPLIYVVDPEGRVSGMFSSWSDETRRALADALAKTVLADSTTGSDAIATDAPKDVPGGMTLRADGAPLDDARVRVVSTDQLMGSRWNMSEQDIDADGEAELVFPDWQGGLRIVKPSTGDIEHIRLTGLNGANVQSVRGVRVDGETCWICTAQSFHVADGARQGKMSINFHAPQGELLWTFLPEVGSGMDSQAQAAAGDIDGDGHIEYVIGLTSFTREQTGENEYRLNEMRGRLIWLDHQGRCIADRELDSGVEMLYVSAGAPGAPAAVLCFSGGQLERYTLAPEKRSD